MKESRQSAVGPYQFTNHSNQELNEKTLRDQESLTVLLHGYSETGFKIYKRLGRKLEQALGPKHLIVAPNGLFPLPKAFPLNTPANQSPEELLAGFAWYFYHAATNQFLIDYKVPVETLTNWIKELNPKAIQIIGYSQGGYLAPFLGQNLVKEGLPLKRVIGINCSFREDMLETLPSYPLFQFQGKEDMIIEKDLAYERFQKLKARGLKEGEFHWVSDVDHKLTPQLSEEVLKIATSPL